MRVLSPVYVLPGAGSMVYTSMCSFYSDIVRCPSPSAGFDCLVCDIDLKLVVL